MALKKPSDFFREDNKSDDTIHELVKRPELQSFSEAFDAYKNNLSKLDNLADTINCVEDIKSEIQDFIKKEDLDNSMMAYTFLLEESINKLKDDVKSINKKDLLQIQGDVSGLTEQINEFVEIEVPKYKSVVVESELRSSNHLKEFKEKINNIIEGIEDSVEDFKKESVSQLKEETLSTLDEKINLVVENKNKDLEKEIKTLKTESIAEYREFIVDNKLKSENNLNEFKDTLDETISKIEIEIDGVRDNKDSLFKNLQKKIKEVKNLKKNIIEDLETSENYKNEVTKKVSGLEIEIIRNESHLKENNNYIEKIQGEVRSTLKRLNLDELERQNSKLTDKIKYLEEVFEKFSEKDILSEGILNITPETNNSDTLTPLNKNFVTLDQLQEHYRVFINRIQQQLSTLGGGGETQLQYLDDIVGIATNLSDYNGKFLKVDTSQPAGKNFVFATTAGGGYVLPTAAAGTLGGIKIGSGLSIDGDGVVTASGGGGSTGVGGTWAIDDVGISTTKSVGIGTTAKDGYSLYVQGDARITGILTVGEASITLDPSAKKLTGLDEIQIGSGTTAITIKKSESTGNIEFADKDGKEAPVGIGTTVNINTTGIITATSFYGSGINLTGIVTSIVAGSNITISGATGQVTINSSGGAAGLWAQTDAGINTSSYVGIGTTNPLADLQVGTGVSVYGNAGIVSATTLVTDTLKVGTAITASAGIVTVSTIHVTGGNFGPIHGGSDDETDAALVIDEGQAIYTHESSGGWLIRLLEKQADVITIGQANTNKINEIELIPGKEGITKLYAGDGTSTPVGILTVNQDGVTVSGILTATTFKGNLEGTIQTAAQTNITSLGTLNSLSVTGDVSIGGTLTYEDVTNIDSVGIITAQEDVRVGRNFNVTGVSTFSSDINVPDNISVLFGTDDDGKIKHTGANLQIQETTGNIQITNYANDLDVDISSDNGSGGTTNYFKADGSTGEAILYNYGSEKIKTTTHGIDVTGHVETDTLRVSGLSTFQNHAYFGDDKFLYFGEDNDFIIGHTAGVNAVTIGSTLYLSDSTSNNRVILRNNGNLEFKDTSGTTKLEVNDTGINVTGITTVGFATATDVWVSGAVTATTFKGSGVNLTSLNATNLASGTVPTARLGSGTADNTVFLRGDNTWATAGGGGGSSKWTTVSGGIHPATIGDNIGIGTTAVSDATLTVDVGTASTAVVVQGSEGRLFSVTNSLSSGSIFSVNDITGIPSIDVDADGTIQLAPYSASENIGLGITNPTSKLHVVGDIKITGVATATDFDATSDIRLKTNIKPIGAPLAKVIQIEGVSFNWKENNIPALGVIADQLEDILPELVRGDDPKTVNYNGLIGLLIEAVKEQQTQIDNLNQRLSKLE